MRGMGNGVYRTGTADIWFGLVDIRDVARAHVLAASRKEASGRHILVNEAHSMIWIAEVLRRHFGEAYPFPRRIVPKWFLWLVGPLFTLNRKFVSRHFGKPLAFDNSYTKSDLGLEFRPLEQTLVEHFQQLLDNGLIRRR